MKSRKVIAVNQLINQSVLLYTFHTGECSSRAGFPIVVLIYQIYRISPRIADRRLLQGKNKKQKKNNKKKKKKTAPALVGSMA